jgi:hypothetical protein
MAAVDHFDEVVVDVLDHVDLSRIDGPVPHRPEGKAVSLARPHRFPRQRRRRCGTDSKAHPSPDSTTRPASAQAA